MDFETLGYYEDIFDADTHKCLGHRIIQKPDRKLGSAGMRDFLLTETLVLQRGHKEIIVKASPQKPKRVTGILQRICGRVIETNK